MGGKYKRWPKYEPSFNEYSFKDYKWWQHILIWLALIVWFCILGWVYVNIAIKGNIAGVLKIFVYSFVGVYIIAWIGVTVEKIYKSVKK